MRLRQRIIGVLLFLAAMIAIGVGVIVATIPRPPHYGTREGFPLLLSDGAQFVDGDLGLRFTPPDDWAMQSRSAEAPKHRPQRQLVKYKRVQPGIDPAWLRVKVSDVVEDQSPADYLKSCKPKESEFTPRGEIEKDISFGGQPAARRTFGGLLNPEGDKAEAFTAMIVALRHGGRIYEFACTIPDSDDNAREQFQLAMESITFE